MSQSDECPNVTERISSTDTTHDVSGGVPDRTASADSVPVGHWERKKKKKKKKKKKRPDRGSNRSLANASLQSYHSTNCVVFDFADLNTYPGVKKVTQGRDRSVRFPKPGGGSVGFPKKKKKTRKGKRK